MQNIVPWGLQGAWQAESLTVSQLAAWLRKLAPWLLILEDADDWDMLTTNANDWSELLPRAGSAGHCLLLTRCGMTPDWLTKLVTASLQVPPLSEDEGVYLLTSLLEAELPEAGENEERTEERSKALRLLTPYGETRNGVSEGNTAAMAYLVSPLGPLSGLPLAIELAAAFIQEHSCSVEEYTMLLQQQRWECSDVDGDTPFVSGNPCKSQVQAVMAEISLPARQLFMLTAFLCPEKIDMRLFVEGQVHLPAELHQFIKSSLPDTSRAMADGVHKVQKLLCEVRRYSLLQFGPYSLGRSHQDGQVAIERFLGADSAFVFSLHHLVQAAVQSIVADQIAETALGAPSCFADLEKRHWVLCSTRNMLSTAATKHGRLVNELYILPHILHLLNTGLKPCVKAIHNHQNRQASRQSPIQDSQHTDFYPTEELSVNALPGTSGGSRITHTTHFAAGFAHDPNPGETAMEDTAARMQWYQVLEEASELVRIRDFFLDSHQLKALRQSMTGLCRGTVMTNRCSITRDICSCCSHEVNNDDFWTKAEFLLNVVQNCPRSEQRCMINSILSFILSIYGFAGTVTDRLPLLFRNPLSTLMQWADTWFLPAFSSFSSKVESMVTEAAAVVAQLLSDLYTLLLAATSDGPSISEQTFTAILLNLDRVIDMAREINTVVHGELSSLFNTLVTPERQEVEYSSVEESHQGPEDGEMLEMRTLQLLKNLTSHGWPKACDSPLSHSVFFHMGLIGILLLHLCRGDHLCSNQRVRKSVDVLYERTIIATASLHGAAPQRITAVVLASLRLLVSCVVCQSPLMYLPFDLQEELALD